MHIFTQNGFEFKDSESGELLLSGVPYSRNQTFGRADVQELAQLLMDSHSTEQKKTVESTADTSQRASVNVSDRIPRPTRYISCTEYGTSDFFLFPAAQVRSVSPSSDAT